jgi:hypothetical protein
MPFRYCVISNTYIWVCAGSLCSTTRFHFGCFNKFYSKQMPRSAAQTFVVKDTQKNYRVILCRIAIAIVFVNVIIVFLLLFSCDYHDVRDDHNDDHHNHHPYRR